MREEKNNDFWDILIWVAVIMAGTWGLEGLLVHFTGEKWVQLVFFLIGLAGFLWVTRFGTHLVEGRTQNGKLSLGELVTAFTAAVTLFPAIFLPDGSISTELRIAFLVAFIPLQARGLYNARRKKEKEARKEEEERREPLELRDRVARAAGKAFIVVSHAREVDLEFELDDRMFLYSLPDGRFLVLFRKDVDMEVFQGTLLDFRSVVDADEDVIGYYGQPLQGSHSGASGAFMCNREGECRPVDFNPATVPISSAVPV